MIFATVIVSVLKQNVHRERFFQLMITGHEENFKP
jgi:hypothetical protein